MADGISIKIKGGKDLNGNLRRISRNVTRRLATEFDEIADELLDRAIALAPQLSGDLIASGRVTGSDTRSATARTVSFDTPYAVRWHENDFKPGPVTAVKPSTQDGAPGPKYLARPFNASSKEWVRRIGNAIEDEMRLSIR